MQSGRGPGVIGMLMALVVLIGFGLLFVFAFDEGMQGGDQSIETLIRNQTKEIESHQARIIDGEKKLTTAPALMAKARELTTLKRENQFRTDRVAGLHQEIQNGTSLLAALGKSFEEYKDKYRAFVRGKAKGETIPELVTKSGGVYKKVSIREVTAIGIQIRHEEGQKRIPFEDLPAALVDYYQFDPSQKAAALTEEHATMAEHEAAASVANEQADQAMAEQREKEALAKNERMIREIATKEALIGTLQADIRGLQSEIQQATEAASAARAMGKIHINKSGSLAGDIRSKQNRIAALRSEIAQMSASVR